MEKQSKRYVKLMEAYSMFSDIEDLKMHIDSEYLTVRDLFNCLIFALEKSNLLYEPVLGYDKKDYNNGPVAQLVGAMDS